LDDVRWAAVEARDEAAVGLFLYAARTTRIYCLPTCPSRRPARRNVVFFGTGAEAAAAGFRACRRCRPDEERATSPSPAAVVAVCRKIEDPDDDSSVAELARQAGWVLYLEGSTDLAILQAFAAKLGHMKAAIALERPFVKYVGNQPSKAKEHFYGLQWALPDLKGVALYDRLDTNLESDDSLTHLEWKKREIENYLCSKRTLGEFAVSFEFPYSEGTLFREAEIRRRADAMRESIRDLCQALETAGQGSPWDDGFKVSDRFLTPLFRNFYRCLELPNPMAKKSFHELAHFVPLDEIDPEIIQKLDAIADVAARCSAGAP